MHSHKIIIGTISLLAVLCLLWLARGYYGGRAGHETRQVFVKYVRDNAPLNPEEAEKLGDWDDFMRHLSEKKTLCHWVMGLLKDPGNDRSMRERALEALLHMPQSAQKNKAIHELCKWVGSVEDLEGPEYHHRLYVRNQLCAAALLLDFSNQLAIEAIKCRFPDTWQKWLEQVAKRESQPAKGRPQQGEAIKRAQELLKHVESEGSR